MPFDLLIFVNECSKPGFSTLFVSLTSLIDRRGFVQSDAPQLAPPTNGIAMYGATQSQQSHMVSTDLTLVSPRYDLSLLRCSQKLSWVIILKTWPVVTASVVKTGGNAPWAATPSDTSEAQQKYLFTSAAKPTPVVIKRSAKWNLAR